VLTFFLVRDESCRKVDCAGGQAGCEARSCAARVAFWTASCEHVSEKDSASMTTPEPRLPEVPPELQGVVRLMPWDRLYNWSRKKQANSEPWWLEYAKYRIR